MRRTLLAFALGLSLFTAHPAFAYTPITELAGDTTWTKAGGPYVVKNITIPAGITLTIEPGTVVKVVTDAEPFFVFGSLNIGDESGEQVLITSISDDTGGDTNEDGATTTPSSGEWRKITFNPGSTGTIVNTQIMYGGATIHDWWTGGNIHFPFIENKGGLLTLSHLLFSNGLNSGFDQYTGTTTVMNSTFSDLTRGIYVVGGSIEIGGNTFSNLNDYAITVYSASGFINRGNNTGGRGIFMGNAISGNQTWAKDNIPYVASSVNIEAGASLTILPGAVVKVPLRISPFYVYGTLSIGASSSDQVLITSINDDSIGGDTNNDNADTTGVAGDWRFISVQPGGTLTTSHATFRYGGLSEYMSNGGWSTPPLIRNEGGNVMIDHSTFTGVNFEGIEQTAGTTTVTNSLFDHTGRYGIYSTGGYFTVSSSTFNTVNEGITAYGGTLAMQGNTFIDSILHDVNVSSFSKFVNHSGNMGSRGIFLDISTNGDLTLPKDGISYIAKSIYISSGNTLTITPGAVVKVPEDASPFYVYGTLNIGSASGEQVIITSEKDDSILGDSNGDSTSSAPSSGDWRTMTFTSGSSATIQNTIIHYAGASPYNSWTGGRDWLPVIKNDGGDLSFDQVTITDNGNYGILQSAGTTTLTNSEVSHTSHYGIFVSGGVATVHQSSIHNNVDYGVYNGSVDSIDATHNWWGAIGGPTHPSNPFGAGDKVTDNVDFGQWLTDEPLGTCTTNCNSSVLFLPGIEASRLYALDDPSCTVINCENQLWEPNRNDDVRELFLDQNGKSTTLFDIYTRDVIDDKGGIAIGGNIYKSFIGSMNAMVTAKTINEWEAIPYDWRLSIDDIINGGVRYGNNISYVSPTTRSYIVDELRSLALHSKTGKVTIIAHSNGGLVAKALINKLGADAENLVDKVVLVAVPQLGTPQAVGALLHGYDQGLPFDWLPILLTPEVARQFSSTSPMAYHLLPSKAYFHSEGIDTLTPIATFDNGVSSQSLVNAYGHAITNYTELQNFLLGTEGRPQPDSADVIRPSKLNQNFLTYGEDLHQLLDDNWTPPASIKIYQIAGFGNETLAGIHYWTGSKCTSMLGRFCIASEPALVYTPKNVVDGDGTVIMTSALAMSTSSANVSRWWVDLDDYNGAFTLQRKHADILEVPELRQFINENILTASTASLPDFIHSSIPSNSSVKRLFFFLHSPLALSVRDSSGSIVNEATSTIPGGRFERYGEVQYISVPAISAPTLELTGMETGSFTLEVKEIVGDSTLASTTFTGIPVLFSARVEMDFTDGTIEHASPLRVDVDGDGHTDYSLAPKVDDIITLPPLDSIAPITTASTTGTLGMSNWYTSSVIVQLIATDTDSGVATTSYSLDNGVTWIMYTIPFTVATEGNTPILFYSTDNTGNREATSTLTLQIDKTAPEAMISVSTSTQDLLVEGKDALGVTTVTKDSSGNFTITDRAGHTTKLFFTKTYGGKRLTYAKLTGIQYDGGTKKTLPSSSFVYLWDIKTPTTLISQTIAVDSTYLIQAVYDKSKNKTTVLVLKKRIPIKTQVFQGLRIPKLTTNTGVIGYSL